MNIITGPSDIGKVTRMMFFVDAIPRVNLSFLVSFILRITFEGSRYL